MIRRIEGSDPIEIVGSTAKQKHLIEEHASTIRFGRKEKNVFFETIKSLWNQIWEFLKYNVFFCFFDAEEEKDLRLAKELREFIDQYCEVSEKIGVEDLSKETKEIKEDYQALDKEIKELIRSSFDDAIKEIKPDISKKRLLKKWKQVQENPFIQIKPKDGNSYQPLMTALFSAQLKLSGHT